MNISAISPALTGDLLIEEMHKAKDQRKALVEGLIYEQSILMVSAPPGLGKSTISSQIAIECAAGIPVFGALQCSRPLKVLYCQTERSRLEFLERAEIISKTYPIAKENLVITDAYKVLNLLKEDHVLAFIQCVERDCPNADIIFIDPIYPMVSGGLSKDEPASAFCKAISLLQKFTNAAIYLNHHTVKPTHNQEGQIVVKDDPFYGSQWLKALVTGSFLLKEKENGTSLIRKKDNYKCLRESIHLEYDGDTELSNIPIDEIPVQDRVMNFIKLKEREGKEFDFNEILKHIECSTRTLRRVMAQKDVMDILELRSTAKNKNMYKVRRTT
jgi:RecA-family ATPase